MQSELQKNTEKTPTNSSILSRKKNIYYYLKLLKLLLCKFIKFNIINLLQEERIKLNSTKYNGGFVTTRLKEFCNDYYYYSSYYY